MKALQAEAAPCARMRYLFTNDEGEQIELEGTFHNPPTAPEGFYRDYSGIVIDTVSCRDADFIPESKRVVQDAVRGNSKSQATRIEKAYEKNLQALRRDARGSRSSWKMTHSVPAELYHGKIKETGDKDYWSDKRNLKRHASTKVS